MSKESLRRFGAVGLLLCAGAFALYSGVTALCSGTSARTAASFVEKGHGNQAEPKPGDHQPTIVPSSLGVSGQPQPEAGAQHRSYQKPVWRVIAEWPGTVNIVGVVTALFIGWQALETRRAVAVTAKAARAGRRQARLTEASMQQWVALENWTVTYTGTFPGALRVAFELRNPTPFLLNMQHGKLVVDRLGIEEIFFRRPAPLAPNAPVQVHFDMLLTSDLNRSYIVGLGFSISGELIFINALGKRVTQNFDGLMVCKAYSYAKFEATVGLTSSDARNQQIQESEE